MLLPNGYLSYSAIQLWIKNKNKYIEQYFLGGDSLDTKYLRFGKQHAEDSSREEDIGITTEYEIRVKILGVPILGFLDKYDYVNNIFIEEKTGKVPWTQTKVQKHDQLPFYATYLKHKIGKMPEKCILRWKETRDCKNGGLGNDIEYTGKVVEFEREFDIKETERIEQLIVKVANEISKAYQEHINNI
jgi:hypothetical protein